MTTETAKTIGKATYTNRVTGESYKLSFDLNGMDDTELSKAWDLVGLAARINGWNSKDIKVQAGK